MAEGVQVGGVGRRCGSECRGLGVRQRECRGCCGWRCRARVVVLASGEVVGSRPVCRSVIKFTCRDASVPRRRDAWRVRVAAWPGSCGVLSAGTGAGVCGCRPVVFAVADPAPAYAARTPLPDLGCAAVVRKAGRCDRGLLGPAGHGCGLVVVPVLRRPGHAGEVGDLLDGGSSHGVAELLVERGLVLGRPGRRPPARPRARAAAGTSSVSARSFAWELGEYGQPALRTSPPAPASWTYRGRPMPCSVTCSRPTAALAQRRRTVPRPPGGPRSR